jgi:FkbM family methyltransferase
VQRMRPRTSDLEFITRSGPRLVCPNTPAARAGVVEVFGLDTYGLFSSGWLVGCRPRRVLDIGAHVGSFTLAVFAQLPDAICVAYEASPTTFNYLCDNVRRSGASERVAVVSAAVTNYDGEVTLHSGTKGDGSASIIPRDEDNGILVSTISFDRVVAERGPFELVKLDCEGAEYGIILGSRRESWESVRHVVLEYHPVRGHSWAELERCFSDLGLQVVVHEPRAGGFGVATFDRRPQ